jgi:hypothetical protein
VAHDHPDFDFDLYSIPARICLRIAIAGSALLAAASFTGVYFME